MLNIFVDHMMYGGLQLPLTTWSIWSFQHVLQFVFSALAPYAFSFTYLNPGLFNQMFRQSDAIRPCLRTSMQVRGSTEGLMDVRRTSIAGPTHVIWDYGGSHSIPLLVQPH
jgi:hypothetical protein